MRSFATAVLGAFALLALASPAAAQYPPAPPGGGVSDNTLVGGETITVSGGGWEPGSQVVISGCGLEEVTVDVDDQGDFSVPVTIPEDQASGVCTVEIDGTGADETDRTVEQRITVVAAATSDAPATTQVEGEMAATGLDLLPGAALSVALLLFGAGALLVARARAA